MIHTHASEFPVDRFAGTSWRRGRLWGGIGGFLGSVVAVGSFALALLIQGEPLSALVGTPYPPIFGRRTVMLVDYFFVAVLVLGFCFLVVGALMARWGRYPRSDGFGAALTGAILSSVAGGVLFLRLWAVLR
ncbi:MAG TPA: hypothetical protein VE618_03385 [Myxococcaceae bacterium]|nr:hypothetical protein [Myxococcaceae bacterium]